MLTLTDHSRYAFFRNRSIELIKGRPSAFWRWWQCTFVPAVYHLNADMPRHAMVMPYRNKDWRKSATARKPIAAKRRTVRSQRIRGHMNVLIHSYILTARMPARQDTRA